MVMSRASRVVTLGLIAALASVGFGSRTARADDDDDAKHGEKGRPVDKGTIGVGIILGEPTGICAKLYLKDDRAIQAAVGGAFAAGGLQVDGDYVFHPWILQDRDSFVLPVYLGPGMRFIEYTSQPTQYAIGLRAVIGMMFDFKAVPLDTFLEVAAIGEYKFGGTTDKGFKPGLNAGLGIRYYF